MEAKVNGSRPHLIVAVGRGRVGKTTLLRWLAEVMQDGALPVQVWDGDPEPSKESLLSRYFDGAERPLRPQDAEARRQWLEQRITEMVKAARSGKPFHAILDVGGDDLLLKRLQGEASILRHLEAMGIAVVAVHVVGADPGDLRYFISAEQSGLFRPERAILVKNEGMIGALDGPEVRFAAIDRHPAVAAFLADRGAAVWMPALPPDLMDFLADEANAGTSLRQWIERDDRLGFVNAIRLTELLDVEMPRVRDVILGHE